MRRKNVELAAITNRSQGDMSSLSAISLKRSNMDDNIDINDDKNKKYLNSFKYLDVELHLNKDDDNSFDEDRFNLEKNTQNFLQKAFVVTEDEQNIWEER